MWAAAPVRFDPGSFRGVVKEIREFKIPEPGDPPFFVHFEMGAQPLAAGTLATLFRNGDEAIGRGIVNGDGSVDIVPDVPFDQGERLSISLQQDKALPAQADVDNSKPQEQPPQEPVNTTLTHSCPADASYNQQFTTTGRLQPGFSGATIKLTYTRQDNTTFERTVTTDATGSWSDTMTPQQNPGPGQFFPFGDWKVRARFDGDTGHNPSSTPDCTFNVND
jgi:hypothetical protein